MRAVYDSQRLPAGLTCIPGGDTLREGITVTEAPRRKKQVGFRLSDDARALLRAIAVAMGEINQTAALEAIIREAAAKRDIALDGQQH